MTIRPSSRYARDHARTYGSWRSQLMHVSVQKSTRTTCPRNLARPSGAELSHSAAPPSEGMCRRLKHDHLPKRPKRRAKLFCKELRLLPGGEVAASVDFVEVNEVGVGLLRPAARRLILLAGKDGRGNGDGDALGVKEATLVFPVQARRRDPRVRQPIKRDVVEDLVTRQFARSAGSSV